MGILRRRLSNSKVLTKTNIDVTNKLASAFLRLMPESIALKILNSEKKKQSKKAQDNHKEAFLRKSGAEKVRIVFILWMPQLWNSLKTVYEASVRSKEVETYVIVCNSESKQSDGSVLTSLEYYKGQCKDIINSNDNGKTFDIANLNPDIIFRQSPYDYVFPKEYSMANLAKIAKTCYVPYNYNFTPNHLHIEYNNLLLADLFALFSDCKTNYEYCVKEHKEFYPDLHTYYYGFPRFDIVRKMQNEILESPRTFTWVPRWNTDRVNNDGTSFFEYRDLLPEYFANRIDLRLIIRPHPNMFKHFISLGLMTQQEVDKYLAKILSIPNVSMDDNMDYLETFSYTDVLIADMSSINYEFYLTGKPIIFCGDISHYNTETKVMYDLMYKAQNWEQLESEMNKLINGVDPNREARLKDVNKAFEGLPADIGEAIVKQCIEIARGNFGS